MIDFMLEKGWNNIFRFSSNRVTPNDNLLYKINSEVITITEEVLHQYGQIPHEGLVYWAGNTMNNITKITHVIAPETDSSEARVTVPPISNFHVVKALSDNRVVHLGQVHSHPGAWIDHSYGDNEWASFKRDGIVSLVVPSYGKNGMLPIRISGVHRYHKNEFIRLSNKYTKSHFRVIKGEAQFIDLRDKNNYRWKRQNGIS